MPRRRCHPSTAPGDSEFTGTIECVRIDLGGDDHPEHISDEHRMHVAMMRQSPS
jgi:arylsulfatase